MKIPFFSPSPAPSFGPLKLSDAYSVARIHAESFARGWDAREVEAMIADPNVKADALHQGATLTAFVLSRLVAGEAEILTIAVAKSARGKGLGQKLLAAHLARLAASRTKALFLEVEETNAAARALYARFGFVKVGERAAYYAKPDGTKANALVLRRDLS